MLIIDWYWDRFHRCNNSSNNNNSSSSNNSNNRPVWLEWAFQYPIQWLPSFLFHWPTAFCQELLRAPIHRHNYQVFQSIYQRRPEHLEAVPTPLFHTLRPFRVCSTFPRYQCQWAQLQHRLMLHRDHRQCYLRSA